MIIRDLVGGKTSKMETMPAVEDDPQRRKPDITRAKNLLNWEPRVPLKVGLEKTIDYFRKELDRSNHSNRNVFVPKRDKSESDKQIDVPNDSKIIATTQKDTNNVAVLNENL